MERMADENRFAEEPTEEKTTLVENATSMSHLVESFSKTIIFLGFAGYQMITRYPGLPCRIMKG